MAAFTGLLTLVEGHENADGQKRAGIVVGDCGAHLGGQSIGKASDIHHAAHGLGHNVIAGAVRQLAVQTKAGDVGVNDSGIDGFHGLIGKAQLFQHTHLVVLADHICGF